MKALRVIFLAGLISALAGGAFAGTNPNGTNQNGTNQNVVAAPEIDFHGSFKWEMLLLAGGGILLLERRRRRRRDSRDK